MREGRWGEARVGAPMAVGVAGRPALSCDRARLLCGPFAMRDRSMLRTVAARTLCARATRSSNAVSTCGATQPHAMQRGASPAGRDRSAHSGLRHTHDDCRSTAS